MITSTVVYFLAINCVCIKHIILGHLAGGYSLSDI